MKKLMCEFLQPKVFSPNGHDVVEAKKGDIHAVPEDMAKIYNKNKVVKPYKEPKKDDKKDNKKKDK